MLYNQNTVSVMSNKGWHKDKERHSIAAQGANIRNSPNVFGYIPGFFKSEHKDYFEKYHGQKKFLNPEEAKRRRKKFRIATRSGTVVYDKEKQKYVVKPSGETYRAKYSPLKLNYPKGQGKTCKVKSCYEEYMYIGKDKIVKEHDMLRGISTLDEFEQTLRALEKDLETGVIDKEQFRWRIYDYHMALLAMSKDNPLNGEFTNYKTRLKAQAMMKQSLKKHGINQKNWKTKSNYYKDMRKIVPGRGKDTSKVVSEDKITYLDKNGRETSKENAVFYLYKEPKTAGDYMHNRRVKQIIEKMKEQKIVSLPKQVKSKTSKRSGKKTKKSKSALNIFGTTGIGASPTSSEKTLQHELNILALTSPNTLEARVKNEISNAFKDPNPEHGKEQLHKLYKAIFTSEVIPSNLKTRYIQMINDEIIAKGWNRNEIIY